MLASLLGYSYKKDPSKSQLPTVTETPLSPPLPLLKFEALSPRKGGPQTVSGEALKAIPNRTDSLPASKPDKIFDPVVARKLSRWFVARSQKEVNYKQMEAYSKHFQGGSEDQKIELLEYVVYESLLYVESKSEREERNSRRPSESQVYMTRAQEKLMDEFGPQIHRVASNNSVESNSGNEDENGLKTPLGQIPFSPSVEFDSEFESGNLEKATRVIGRDTIMSERASECLGDYAVPGEVDQEYDLVLRNDINTDGNIQWYYFSVKVDSIMNGVTTQFPLKVRFNLINMQKKDSLYNYGMKPCIFSTASSADADWFNGGYDICYYKNGLTNWKAGKKNKMVIRNQYTFTFTYTFERPDLVYFAYTYPYTYSDLQRFLVKLESDPKTANYVYRRTLCRTLAGNKCDVLTITERSEGAVETKYKPGIVVSARIHPGESNSSYVVHGLIEFLCSEALEAVRLRKTFIFTIVPMLNPDGVIHGNYRCSLAGTDLNRRFMDCHPALHPTIVAFKELIRTVQSNRSVALFLDLHGHSKLKNSFIYGCDVSAQPEKYSKYLASVLSEDEINQRRIFCRIFPKILCTMSKSSTSNGYFSYRDCSFNIDKSKFGTGRVVSWRDLGVMASYTIEMSFCGNGDNTEKKTLRKCFDGTGGGVNSAGQSAKGKIPPRPVKKKKPKKAKRRKSKFAPNEGENFDLLSTMQGANSNEKDEEGGDDDANEEEDDEIIADQEEVAEDPPVLTSTSTKSVNFSSSEPSKSAKTTVVPLDSSVLNLLDSYKTAVHYQKVDLFTMGKHICQAMYHFANLTHADMEYEKELIIQYDRDTRERQRKEQLEKQLMMKYPVSSNNFSVNSSSQSINTGNGNPSGPSTSQNSQSFQSQQQQDNQMQQVPQLASSSSNAASIGMNNLKKESSIKEIEEIDYIRQAIDKLYGETKTVIPEISHASTPSPLLSDEFKLSARESFDVSSSTKNVSESTTTSTVGIAVSSPIKGRNLPPLSSLPASQQQQQKQSYQHHHLRLIGDENIDGNNEFNDDEGSDNESEDSNNAGDNTGDGIDPVTGELLDPNNMNGGNMTTSTKSTGANNTGKDNKDNLQEIFASYLENSTFDVFQNNMTLRALTKNGVFHMNAIQSLIQSYANEFSIEKSTQNIGFRIKCELAIRKLLKLDDHSLPIQMNNLLEEEADSGDESESNPSVDNQPTSRLLRAVSSNDTSLLSLNNVVSALKQVIRKKKHKELLLKKKRDKKLALKLMKQAEMARKLALENERLRKEKEDKSKGQRPFSANASKSEKKRRGIHSSLPKFAPLYRMAPVEGPKINVPVQIKLMNFKDFDPKNPNNKKGNTPPIWSQINTVFYDDDQNNTNNLANYQIFDPQPPEPNPNPLLQQIPKPRKSSIYLNPNNNRGSHSAGGALFANNEGGQQYWQPKASSPTNAEYFTSETANNSPRARSAMTNAMNDANIVYAPPMDLTPTMLLRTSLTSGNGARRQSTNYSFKEVSFDLNNEAANPSNVNMRRITNPNTPEGIVQTFGILPATYSAASPTANSTAEQTSTQASAQPQSQNPTQQPPFFRPPPQFQSIINTTAAANAPDKTGSPRSGKVRRSTISI